MPWRSGLSVLCVFLFSAGAVPADAAPLGRAGTTAVYALESDPAERPEFERENRLTVVSAEIMVGPVERVAGEGASQWYGLSWTRLNGDRYGMWALIDGWPTADRDPNVRRYLWREPDWPDALAFTHEVTGEAMLPRICLWTYGWPQVPEAGGGSARAPARGTPERILLQGWPFRRVSVERSRTVRPPVERSEVALNPDLLIGWISQDRDVDGRPSYRLPDGACKYQHKSEEELKAHAGAGCNFYVSHPKRALPPWVTRSGLYHSNLSLRPEDWPADLYRSNYWGHGNHVDEPGVHNWGMGLDDDPDAPAPLMQAVESLQRIVRKGVEERGGLRINDLIDRNFGRGDLVIVEQPETIYAWEYEWPTAWYQLAVEDGVGGIIDEDATLNDLVETYNMAFGTAMSPTVENACAIRVAVLRGAARNFGKRWGVAIYHPNEVKLKSAAIPYLYEKGASRFWFWTGWVGITDNSGLPYPYQRYYASLVRQAFEAHPERDMEALLFAAKVAVVIPYGYTFTPYHMHRIPRLHLEVANEHGVRYRDVLGHAAHEVERLLRMGVAFDIAVDDPLFHKTGYDELIYVQADGRIRIERPGAAGELLDAPRAFQRPDLGPGPNLTIEDVTPEDADPDDVTLRAVATIGTGEWAGERPEPLISWEVYGPDGRVRPDVFPEYGAERTIDVDLGETWVVRAATADVFGRPAVAYRTVSARPESVWRNAVQGGEAR